MEELRELFHFSPNLLLSLGGLLLATQVFGRLANKLGAPRITGYLVSGVLLGPEALALFKHELVDQRLEMVNSIALAVIAFAIGGALELRELKKLGRRIVEVSASEALLTPLVVTLVMTLFLLLGQGNFLGFSLSPLQCLAAGSLLGVVCMATAPAAILAIIEEKKAKGQLSSLVMGIVALDDGFLLLIFSLVAGFALRQLGEGPVSWVMTFAEPLYHIFGALLIGSLAGLLLCQVLRFFHNSKVLLAVALGTIFITSGLAHALEFSQILTVMMFGFVTVNTLREHALVFRLVEEIDEPIFGMFFFLAGAHLEFSALATGGLAGLVMSLARFAGKYYGTRWSTKALGFDQKVYRNAGFALLPQAGVAIALMFELRQRIAMPELSEFMLATILAAILMNELITPLLVQHALKQAGEVGQQPEGS